MDYLLFACRVPRVTRAINKANLLLWIAVLQCLKYLFDAKCFVSSCSLSFLDSITLYSVAKYSLRLS